MAIQGYTTGGQGLLLMAPIRLVREYDRTVTPPVLLSEKIELATPVSITGESPVIANKMDFYENYGEGSFLELAIFSSKEDEVGIISTAPSFDATPKSIAFTIDRDDKFSMRFLQRYCKSLRMGLEVPAATTGTNAKEYEDGLSVRGDAKEEEEKIDILDTIFFVWAGPELKGIGASGKSKVVWGFAGVGSTSANFSTSFQTDNQFTFTLTSAPQTIDASETGLDIENFVFNSAVGANFGAIGGANGIKLKEPIKDGRLGKIFGGYAFKIPAKTGFMDDDITILTEIE